MKKIILPRRAWKTSKLVQLSYDTWKYIVCSDRNRVENIVDVAKKMELEIPFPVTIQELKKSQWSSLQRDWVLVDDFDDIVRSLVLQNFRHIDIDTVSMTDERIF